MDHHAEARRHAIHEAATLLGGQAGLARVLRYKDRRNVHPWMSGERPLPPEHCVRVEQETGGAVGRKRLRPDDWFDIWPELKDAAAPVSEGAHV
ncbi:YdaS family helix-turn-helix protein [Pseudorhodoferax sp. Leaf274]|uniref:transcriptional regulator n=1 Tax=Pseudorhodoferax sp. Leaf274 TaxID=1736318 RepID=UPI0009E729BB|nr:YdaS family helix-turn-helix protein [Pseudorhodoferax sp. Leaf274]